MNNLTAAQRPDLSARTRSDPLHLDTLRARHPRTSLTDRIAMRIALRLLLWSTRPAADHEQVAQRRRLQHERQEREAHWLLMAHLLPHR